MNLLDLAVAITVDDQASSKIASFANMTGKTMSSLQQLAVSAISGVQKLASATVSAIGSSVSAYADYEQMAGGVAKLYGNAGQTLEEFAAANNQSADEAASAWERNNAAQATVMANAQTAWKTTGLSANEYMETATQFSASLISSLGGDTQAAADLTQTAMEAMSDNVNTFGTNFEDVSNAFKGFSKQNYTMLDNLKLGYGGTQAEMERLIADANEYAASIGESSDLTIDSFADQVKAIQLIQRKQQIAGTTAREASTTIQGSVAAAKAAWQNFATTLATGSLDDIRAGMGEVNEAVGTAVDNIAPKVIDVINNLGDLLSTGFPVTISNLFAKIDEYGPAVGAAIGNLFSGAGDFIASAGPTLANKAGQMLQSVLTELPAKVSAAIPSMITTIGDIVVSFMQGLLPAKIGEPLGNVVSTIFSSLSSSASEGLSWMTDSLPGELGGAVETVVGIFTALLTRSNPIFAVIATVIKGAWAWFTDTCPDQVQTVKDTLSGVFESLSTVVSTVASVIGPAIQSAFNWFTDTAPGLIQGASDTVQGVFTALSETLGSIVSTISGVIGQIATAFSDTVSNIAPSTSSLEALFGAVQTMVGGVSSYVGGIWSVIQTVLTAAASFISGFVSGIVTVFTSSGMSSALSGLGDAFSNLWTSIQSAIQPAGELISTIFGAALTVFGELYGAIGNLLTQFSDFAGQFTPQLESVGEVVGEIVGGALGMLISTITTIVDGISAVITIIGSVLGVIVDLPSTVSSVVATIGQLWTQASTAVQTFVSGVISKFTGFVTDLGQKATEAASGFLTALQTGFSTVTSWVSGVPDSIVSAIGDVGNLLWNAGSSIMEGFLNGLKSFWDDVTGWISGVAEWIAANKGPIDYDRQLLIPHGRAIMEGFGEGLQDGFSDVQSDVSTMADRLADSMSTPVIDASAYSDAMARVGIKGGYDKLLSAGGSISVYNLTIDGAKVNQDVASITGDYLLDLARIGAL